MNRKTIGIGFAALVALMPSVLAGVVSFQGLGDLPGDGDFQSVAFAVSAGGSVVVGNHNNEAAPWARARGMVGLGAVSRVTSEIINATADGLGNLEDGLTGIAVGAAANVNVTGTMDDSPFQAGADCNSNGIPDATDIADGTSSDCNTNGIPDECDTEIAFSAQQVISTATNSPQSVFAADLDGDGDVDVLSASFFDNKIAWYENTDGLGNFGLQRVINTAANFAESVFSVDLDGDGDADVLSASYNDDKIAWYENTDGLGNFGLQQVISTAADEAWFVSSADLDGDGDADVLSASRNDDKIAWYENTDGLGTFGPQQVITITADDARSVFCADLDGDGDADVLSASANDDKIAWYENTDGLGTFGPQQVITTTADAAQSVFSVDLDGDGDADVLSASFFDDKIAWYENSDGAGTFGAQQIITTTADGARFVFSTDLDGDGDADVLSASYLDNKIAWYENTDGLGTFGPQEVITTTANGAVSIFSADLDGDGDKDVLSASQHDNKIAWYENTGDDCNGNRIPDECDISDGGSNDCNTNGVPDECESDCNNDGIADECEIAAGAPDCNTNGVLDECEPDCNTNGISDDCDIAGGAPDCNANRVPDECELADNDCDSNGVPDDCDIAGGEPDCNTDGVPDDCEFASGAPDCNTNGIPDECDTATAFSAQQVITSVGVRSIFSADLDGDGDADVLSASNIEDTIAWYENTDGLGTFGPEQVITSDDYRVSSVISVDLDDDGDADVLSAASFDDRIGWYENLNGLGTFGSRHDISLTANDARSIFSADLDGDGDADALSALYSNHTIAWYENQIGEPGSDADGFGPEQVITTDAVWAHAVISTDLDGDGDADVLSASVADDKIAWYENTDGAGTFGPQQVITTTADGAGSVFCADLDGDGDADVLSASIHDDKIAWYENLDGLGSFGPQQVITTAADWAVSVIATDLDGDGDADVLSASVMDDKTAWYENLDGLGTFGPQRVITDANGAQSATFSADVDGDGDADVLSASRDDDTIAWYENTGDDCNGNRIPDACELDTDIDGKVDGCDRCAGGAASGDTDANGSVDLGDYADLSGCILGPGAGLGSGCECFDFNSDNDVDLENYAEFQNGFTGP